MGRAFRYHITVFCLALLGGCGELTPPDERRAEVGSYYTVRPGDTLYSIAWGRGVDHRDLAAWNSISPPYLIHPGLQLTLTPPLYFRSTDGNSARSTAPSTLKSPPKASTARGSQQKNRRSPPPKKSSNDKKMRGRSSFEVEKSEIGTKLKLSAWGWPTHGKVIARFDPDSGKKGIDIAGKSGQAIFSAAAGDVVYSGSGLLGYGNLIIIKHDEAFLSAYGHNSQLLVKEGGKVRKGQEIAKMGVSPKEGAMLHFEIRKEGKPVDPSRYLPKKN